MVVVIRMRWDWSILVESWTVFRVMLELVLIYLKLTRSHLGLYMIQAKSLNHFPYELWDSELSQNEICLYAEECFSQCNESEVYLGALAGFIVVVLDCNICNSALKELKPENGI
jgi:hypothetical protein